MNKKGFTLIELLIVVAIIGILAMIAVPSFIGQGVKAARTEAYTNLQNLRLLEEQRFADSGSYIPGAGTAALIAALPGFKPGSDLKYTYVITAAVGKALPTPVPYPYAGTTVDLAPATTPCFIATATGNAGTRVADDKFAVDCNNNRNF